MPGFHNHVPLTIGIKTLRRLTMCSRGIAVILSLLASSATPVANAQEHLEPVEGVVVDETGAAIPHVKLLFQAGSDTLVAYTGANGVVRVMLAAGRYEVTISQFGFATTRLDDFFVLRPNVDTFRVVLKVAARILILWSRLWWGYRRLSLNYQTSSLLNTSVPRCQ